MTRLLPHAAMLAALLWGTGLSAQAIPTGRWTGTVTPPGAQGIADVWFVVALASDTLQITLHHEEFGAFRFRDVVAEPTRLTFSFSPGTPVDCVLRKQDDGSFEGECVDADGDAGVLLMRPPGHPGGRPH